MPKSKTSSKNNSNDTSSNNNQNEFSFDFLDKIQSVKSTFSDILNNFPSFKTIQDKLEELHFSVKRLMNQHLIFKEDLNNEELRLRKDMKKEFTHRRNSLGNIHMSKRGVISMMININNRDTFTNLLNLFVALNTC